MMSYIFTGLLHLVLVLLVQLTAPAQIPPPPNDKAPRGMRFQEVLARSLCHTMEQLVDVEQEFPADVGFIYMPACVSLRRCSGCCSDEKLECHPTLQRNITVQMIRIAQTMSSDQVELTFLEHQKCECRARQTLLKKTGTGCGKCQFPQKKKL